MSIQHSTKAIFACCFSFDMINREQTGRRLTTCTSNYLYRMDAVVITTPRISCDWALKASRTILPANMPARKQAPHRRKAFRNSARSYTHGLPRNVPRAGRALSIASQRLPQRQRWIGESRQEAVHHIVLIQDYLMPLEPRSNAVRNVELDITQTWITITVSTPVSRRRRDSLEDNSSILELTKSVEVRRSDLLIRNPYRLAETIVLHRSMHDHPRISSAWSNKLSALGARLT